MDAPQTVFYLVPFNNNKYAIAIVNDPANSNRVCRVPYIANGPVLRIGLDQKPKSPPHLVRFGRHKEHNDVILNNHFSRNDQCYFDINKDTGELLLHDISEKNDTELRDILVTSRDDQKVEQPGSSQIWKSPRQCVVVLSPDPYVSAEGAAVEREWILQIGTRVRAEFRLVPPRTHGQDGARLTEQKLEFARQHDPELTVDCTLGRALTLGLEALRSQAMTTTYQTGSTTTYNPHNTRFRTPIEPEAKDVIRSTKLRPLGRGAQGDVHKVVDMYNGNHHACKIVAVKAEVPGLKIYSEKAFKARVEREINLVRQLKHVRSSFRSSAFIMLTFALGPYRTIPTLPGIQESEYRNFHAYLRWQPS